MSETKPVNNFLNQIFNLENKVAVVIGGGGYLCSEMARGFARAGCAVAVLDFRLEKAQDVKAKLKAEGFNPSKEEIRTFYDYYFKTR